MTRRIIWSVLFCFFVTQLPAQEATPTATATPEPRSLLGRILNPLNIGGGKSLPKYKDPHLRGLVLDLQLAPLPVKLSETRHLDVKLTLKNDGKRAVTLDFPTDQRIEIYLRSTNEDVLTKFSENHAFEEKPGTVMINPGEHVEYSGSIATRELTPNKVFIAEVFLPKYPELTVRQKFMTAP